MEDNPHFHTFVMTEQTPTTTHWHCTQCTMTQTKFE